MAVMAMASSTGRKMARTGIKSVPRPNPEKRVSPAARNATRQTRTVSISTHDQKTVALTNSESGNQHPTHAMNHRVRRNRQRMKLFPLGRKILPYHWSQIVSYLAAGLPSSSATSLLPGQDKLAPSAPTWGKPRLWFLVGLGCLRLESRQFLNRRSPWTLSWRQSGSKTP